MEYWGKSYKTGDILELDDQQLEKMAKSLENQGYTTEILEKYRCGRCGREYRKNPVTCLNCKATHFFELETGKIIENSEKNDHKGLLAFKTAENMFGLKPSKTFIIDQLILPRTITMFFSPPKQYKSLIALYSAMCVANGKPFFGLKTKKCNVLYLDRENSDSLIHQRLCAIRKGHPAFVRKNFPLSFLIRNGDFENKEWVRKLIQTVQEQEIRLIYIDTVKRYSTNFDENSANDINRIYMNVLQPLIDQCHCSIVFLHHTNRDGAYRGSGDFLGLVDSAYQITKIGKDGFKIVCYAARGGEIDEVNGVIDIAQDSHHQLDSVTFIQKTKDELNMESSEKWTKKKEACNLIMAYFKTKGLHSYKKKDIEYAILLEKKDDISKETIKKAFEFLVFKNILARNTKGTYTKIGDWLAIGD